MYLAFSDCPYGAHSVHCGHCQHRTDTITGRCSGLYVKEKDGFIMLPDTLFHCLTLYYMNTTTRHWSHIYGLTIEILTASTIFENFVTTFFSHFIGFLSCTLKLLVHLEVIKGTSTPLCRNFIMWLNHL